MKKIITLILAVLVTLGLSAQELKCTVSVSTSQLQGTNKQVFETLQTALNEFMNNHHWTDLVYGTNERIECTFVFNVSAYNDDILTTTLQVQARRPVYGTSYTTTLFNWKDKAVNFSYIEYDPIEVNTSTYENNLTAVLAYYAYIIIGLDLDSYSKMGGTPAFQQAEQIVSMSQNRSSSEGSGWKAFDDDKNRYALVNNLQNERFQKLREYYYEYHRQALDNMATNVDNGRARIASGLSVIREINRLEPSAAAIEAFLDAKNDELISLFSSSKAPAQERTEVYNVLMDVNPALGTRYDAIKP